MTMYGANADELDRVAKAMIDAADDLENDTGFLSRLIQSVPWVGGVAKAFISTWESNHARRLQQSVQFLRLTADGLTKNATQQRDASNDTGKSGGGRLIPKPQPFPMPPDVRKLAADLVKVAREVPFWGRAKVLARVLSHSLGTMGAAKVSMAVAAVAASGKEGKEVLRWALAGTKLLSPRSADAVRDIIQNAGGITQRPPKPTFWQRLGKALKPVVTDFVRQIKQILPIVVPWTKPFIFGDCYPVSLGGVSLSARR